jgi:hypothetical protein
LSHRCHLLLRVPRRNSTPNGASEPVSSVVPIPSHWRSNLNDPDYLIASPTAPLEGGEVASVEPPMTPVETPATVSYAPLVSHWLGNGNESASLIESPIEPVEGGVLALTEPDAVVTLPSTPPEDASPAYAPISMTPVSLIATLSVADKDGILTVPVSVPTEDGAAALDPVDPNAQSVSMPSAPAQIPRSLAALPSTPAQDGAPAVVPVPATPVSTESEAVDTGEALVAVPSEPAALRSRFVVIKDVKGDNAGEEHWLFEGENEQLVVGSAPTGEGNRLVIEGDSLIDPSHVKLELEILQVEGECIGVRVKVTDLESAHGVVFKGQRIAFGRSGHARCGDTIGIGNHVLKVCRK